MIFLFGGGLEDGDFDVLLKVMVCSMEEEMFV